MSLSYKRIVEWMGQNNLFLANILLLIAVYIFYTLFYVADFDIRTANISSDDGLMVVNYVLNNPEKYQKDVFILEWSKMLSISMMTWLPYFAGKISAGLPEIFSIFWLFLQNVGLAVTSFLVGFFLSRKYLVAWLGAAISMAIPAYVLNLASYGCLAWMPYAGHLATPFALLALISLVFNNRNITYLSLIIAGFMHPSFAAYTATFVTFYTLIDWYLNRKKGKSIPYFEIIKILISFVIAITPSLYFDFQIDKTITPEFLDHFFGNAHAAPWTAAGGHSHYWDHFKSSLIHTILMIIAGLGIFFINRSQTKKSGVIKADERIFHIWFSSIAVVLIFFILHYLSWYIRFLPFFSLITTRSSMFIIFFAIPIISFYIISYFSFFSWYGIIGLAGFITLTMHGSLSPTLLTALIVHISFILLYLRTKEQHHFLLTLGNILFSIIVLYSFSKVFLNGVQSVPHFFSLISVAGIPFFIKSLIFISLVLIFNQTATLFIKDINIPKNIFLVLSILCITAMTLNMRYHTGKRGTTGEFRSWYLLQDWANKNSPENSLFILLETSLYGSWRNFANRPVFTPYPFISNYSDTKVWVEYSKKMVDYYQEVYQRPVSRKEGVSLFQSLNENQLKDMANYFQVDFIVMRANNPRFTLPVVYKNDHFKILKLR